MFQTHDITHDLRRTALARCFKLARERARLIREQQQKETADKSTFGRGDLSAAGAEPSKKPDSLQ